MKPVRGAQNWSPVLRSGVCQAAEEVRHSLPKQTATLAKPSGFAMSCRAKENRLGQALIIPSTLAVQVPFSAPCQ
jgi:hypothetical protein